MNKQILSVRGYRLHGIKDSRWSIRDKVYQYKGVLKLYGSQKKIKATEATRLRKRLAKEIKTLRDEIKEYREILKEVESGDRRRMHQVLQADKNIQLAYQDRNPIVVYEALNQDCSLRREQLDECYYLKKIKMKEFFDLKLECTILMNKYDEQNQLRDPDPHQQKLASLYQKYVANRNAAESIRNTYLAMIKILKKDTVYFNAIINALKEDKMEQCKVLLRAIFMGQLAAEELDDTREKYKKMARDVWKNMKERERTLNILRSRVENLWADIRELVRVESDPILEVMDRQPADNDHDDDGLERHIKLLEETFDKVKETLMARSYEELFDRFEEQARQKKHLLKKLEDNLEVRESLINKRNCATLILADLNNSLISTSGEYDKYKADKKEILEEIKIAKKREDDFIKSEKSREELLINIKCALQNILAMMVFIRPGWGGVKKSPREKKRDRRKTSESSDGKASRKSKAQFIEQVEYHLEKFDPDVLTLLNQVTKKANMLFGLSNFEMTPEEKEKAKNLYQSYVAEKRSKIYYENDVVERKEITVEHEIIDLSVISRSDIKNQSKNLIEMCTRLD
ncbi:uncharacterized protein LOC123268043 [Cotesia glomerata]|nr:uncharacterized protein LOC123268043 [Cotesia glomerata]